MNFLEFRQEEEHQQNIRGQQQEKGQNIYFEFPCGITMMGNPQMKIIVSIKSFAPGSSYYISPFLSVVMASCCDYLLGYLLNFVVRVPCPHIAKYVFIKL